MDTGSALDAFELPKPILAARLASLLRTGRRDAGTRLRQLARASGGAFTVSQLRRLEAGELALDGVDLLALAELYAVDISGLLLERVPLTIDRAAGTIRTGGITRSFELGHPEAMLIAYLKLVRELRDLQHEPTIVIRRDDVDVLSDALGTDGGSVIEKLGELMHLTVAQRRSMVTAFLAGATVIALAGGALAVDSATFEPSGDTDDEITSVSAFVDLPDDALGGAPARDGATLVWTDLDRPDADDATDPSRGEGREEPAAGPVDLVDEDRGAEDSRKADVSNGGDPTADRNDDGVDGERVSFEAVDPDRHAEGDGEEGSGGRDDSRDEDTGETPGGPAAVIDDRTHGEDGTGEDGTGEDDAGEDDAGEDDAGEDDAGGEGGDDAGGDNGDDGTGGEGGDEGGEDNGDDGTGDAGGDDGDDGTSDEGGDDTGEDDGTGGEGGDDTTGDEGGDDGDDMTDDPGKENNGVGSGVGGGKEHNRGKSG
jgi:hypothetical protein